MAFDKTGTLTSGRPRLLSVVPVGGGTEEALVACAAGAESLSSHPIARAVIRGRIERALAKAAPQLGSVGGGNHFVELQCDRDTGEVWVMVHCGSRGFGWQTADWASDLESTIRQRQLKARLSGYSKLLRSTMSCM
jgi:cation transport ATPase